MRDIQEIKKEMEFLKNCVGNKRYPTISQEEYGQLEKIYLFLSQKTDLTEAEINQFEQDMLRTLLHNLGEEIRGYEAELDAEYIENLNAEKYVSINREDYYRVVDDYNLLEDKEVLRKTDLEELERHWRDSAEMKEFDEDKLKVAWSYQAKEELRKKKLANTTENYHERTNAIWHDLFGVICFFAGIVLGYFTKSGVTSVLMIFTSILLMKEAFETSNITVASRSKGAYIFSYTQYSWTVGIASFIWVIYLVIETKAYTALAVFTVMMFFQLLCLSSYDKQIWGERKN